MSLTLGEPWQPWPPNTWRATWVRDGELEEVLAIVAPAHDDPDALQIAAQPALATRGEGVLPLRAVVPLGDRVAWLYPDVSVVSLQVLGPGELGPRGSAELLASVSRTVGTNLHPGPQVQDVVLDSRARVRLANFHGPFASGPVAPGDGTPEQKAVYRLGALLVATLVGKLERVVTRETHEAAIRRTIIRAKSSPGAVFSDRYAEALRSLVAYEPGERPSLGLLPDLFDDLAQQSGGPTLSQLVGDRFDTWSLRARHGFSNPRSLTEPDSGGLSLSPAPGSGGRSTLESAHIIGDFGTDDDPTVETHAPGFDGTLDDISESSLDNTPPSVLERGSIPVTVGPPAEAIGTRPQLPSGFLGSPESDPDVTAVESRPPKQSGSSPQWFVPVTLVLCAFAVLLSGWILFG